MNAGDGEDILVKALTHRHPHRSDRNLNMWFFMLDLSAENTAMVYEFVGAHAVCCVSRTVADCLRPFLVRCYVCNTIKAARFFSPFWLHWVDTLYVTRCPTCTATGEVCLDMQHPNCYQCEQNWHHIGDSDSDWGGWPVP